MKKFRTELSADDTTIYIYKDKKKIGSIELGEPFEKEDWVENAVRVLAALVVEVAVTIAEFDEPLEVKPVFDDLITAISTELEGDY